MRYIPIINNISIAMTNNASVIFSILTKYKMLSFLDKYVSDSPLSKVLTFPINIEVEPGKSDHISVLSDDLSILSVNSTYIVRVPGLTVINSKLEISESQLLMSNELNILDKIISTPEIIIAVYNPNSYSTRASNVIIYDLKHMSLLNHSIKSSHSARCSI